MTETADVVVIGLGAVGSATLHRLALRGVQAVGIDRFDPPHDRGSTHGETRITRLSIAEGAAYVPLARRSHAIWRELEAQTGETLFSQIGMLVIGEGDGAPSHGQAGFLGSTLAIAASHAIPHELLDSARDPAALPAVPGARRGARLLRTQRRRAVSGTLRGAAAAPGPRAGRGGADRGDGDVDRALRRRAWPWSRTRGASRRPGWCWPRAPGCRAWPAAGCRR